MYIHCTHFMKESKTSRNWIHCEVCESFTNLIITKFAKIPSWTLHKVVLTNWLQTFTTTSQMFLWKLLYSILSLPQSVGLTKRRWSWTWGDILKPLIFFIRSTNSSAGIVPEDFLSLSRNACRACSVGRFWGRWKGRRKMRGGGGGRRVGGREGGRVTEWCWKCSD